MQVRDLSVHMCRQNPEANPAGLRLTPPPELRPTRSIEFVVDRDEVTDVIPALGCLQVVRGDSSRVGESILWPRSRISHLT